MAKQNQIPVNKNNLQVSVAGTIGNNAAWICVNNDYGKCSNAIPIVGSTLNGLNNVECPICNQKYKVIGHEGKQPQEIDVI